MAQTFEYPNLLTGSRSGRGWKYASGGLDQTRHCLYNSTGNENFLYSPTFRLVHGVDYTVSVFTANTANCASSELYILSTDFPGKAGWIAKVIDKADKGPEGGWVTCTFSLPSTSPEGNYQIRFDNDGSTDGKDALIWFDSPMLCIASEPHAWAPAEGEVLE